MNTPKQRYWILGVIVVIAVLVAALILFRSQKGPGTPTSNDGLRVVPADATSIGNGSMSSQIGPTPNASGVQSTPAGSAIQQTGTIQ